MTTTTTARLVEEPPFKEHNSDQSINPSSYRVLAGVGTVEYAQDLLYRHLGSVPSVGQVKLLARFILQASDQVQANVRSDGHVDRMAGSHTRARGAVRAVIDMVPPPFGEDEQARVVWQSTVIERATELFQVGISLAYEP